MYLTPARDIPRRWVLVWAPLLMVGLLSSVTSSIADGFDWLDVLGVPFLLYVAVTNLMRAKTLLSRVD